MTQLRWADIAAIVIVGLVLYLLLADARDERRPSRRAVGTASHAATALEAESQETADAAASRSHATMRVLLASGRPAAGASVVLDGAVRVSAEAGRDGLVRIAGLAHGPYDVTARRRAQAGAMQIDYAGERDLGTLHLAGAVRVQGRVMDASGAPIADAQVEVVRTPTHTPLDAMGIFNSVLEPGPVAARARTDHDGTYTLRVPAAGRVSLRATAIGYAQESILRRTFATTEVGLDFHLSPGLTVAGWIVDEQDEPVPHAQVLLAQPSSLWSGESLHSITFADEQGHFELTAKPHDDYSLIVRARGYAPLMQTDLHLPEPELRLALERGATMRLRAVDADRPKQPLPGVAVSLWFDGGFARTTTDEHGEARLHHLIFDNSNWFFGDAVALWGAGSMPRKIKYGKIEPRDGVLDLGDVALRRGGTLQGRVLDDASGKPIAGAYVRPLGGLEQTLDIFTTLNAISDANGNYELHGVAPTATTVLALHRDYIPNVGPDELLEKFGDTSGPSLFADGENAARHDIRLTRAGTIRGTVLAPDGTPQPGAIIRTNDAEEEFNLFYGEAHGVAVSGADGKFRVHGIRAGEQLVVRARHPDFGEEVRRPARAGANLTITLRAARQLAGRVIDADGKPIAGVRVRITLAPREDRKPNAERFHRLAVTDAGGRFRVLRTVPGKLLAHLSHPEFAPLQQAFDATEARSMLDIGLVRLRRGASISGIVIDGEDMPCSDVEVTASPADASQFAGIDERESLRAGAGVTNRTVRSDARGRFRIVGLREGRFRLLASREDHVSSRPVADTGGEDARIQLLPTARLEGRVFGRGRAVVGATVRAVAIEPGSDPEEIESTRTDKSGRFLLGELPPDRPFRLTIRHDEFIVLQRDRAHASTRVEQFMLDSGNRIAGIVTDASGAPLRYVRIGVRIRRRQRQINTDARGRFSASGLPDARVLVWIETADTDYVATKPIRVAPDDTDIHLVTELGGPLEGVVRDVAGKAIQEFTIVVRDSSGVVRREGRSGQTNGKFEIRGLPIGRYAIEVIQRREDGGHAVIAQAAEVATGTRNLDLRAAR